MSDNSSIEWTDATWNVVTGCVEVSPGCDHCYAKTFAERWRGVAGHHFEQGFDVVLRPERLDLPLRWRRPRRVFVNSMSDLFHEAVPDDYIAGVFDVMMRTPEHTFQILTKRHGRMRSLLNRWAPITGTPPWTFTGPWPIPNVWLGVSVENQQWADIRVPALLETPAAVRWISAEPLLGPVDLHARNDGMHHWLPDVDAETGEQVCQAHGIPDCRQGCAFIDWIVGGGESGPGARPMHPDWARGLQDQCTSASVPYFHKQNGQFAPVLDRPAAGDLWLASDGATTEWQHGDGYVRQAGGDYRWPGTRTVLVRRARSKHAAGRLLDGRTWDEYPTVEPAVSDV